MLMRGGGADSFPSTSILALLIIFVVGGKGSYLSQLGSSQCNTSRMQCTWQMAFLEPRVKLGSASHKMGPESQTLSPELLPHFGLTGQNMILKLSFE